MAKITKTFVDKVQSPEKGYVIHWDGGYDRAVKGYGLRVTASGVRSFVAQGRVQGKAVIVTIGRYGLYTEAEARERAQKVLQQMRDGIDPRDVKRTDEAMAVTLGEVCTGYVIRPGKLKQSTADEYQRHVDKVFAAWKDKPIVAITEDDVRKRHREMVEKGLDGKGAPASANAAMVTLRILVNFASRQYRRADGTPLPNLCGQLILGFKQLRQLARLLEHIETNGGLVFDQMTKAVGCPPQRVKQLREANTAAEKAMVLRDVA